jgi:hypothetical protein
MVAVRQKLFLASALFALLFLSAALFSCEDEFLSIPDAPDDSGAPSAGALTKAPEWVDDVAARATQGDVRSITLSWKPVPGAARYFIYHSDSPLNEFSQCGETRNAETSITMNVPSETFKYYKVTAVNTQGQPSPLSEFVFGSSMASPVITFAERLENSAVTWTPPPNGGPVFRIYWRMANLEAGGYQDSARYFITYTKDGGAENRVPYEEIHNRDPLGVSGEIELEAGGTEYIFQVWAYKEAKESIRESSDRVSSNDPRWSVNP